MDLLFLRAAAVAGVGRPLSCIQSTRETGTTQSYAVATSPYPRLLDWWNKRRAGLMLALTLDAYLVEDGVDGLEWVDVEMVGRERHHDEEHDHQLPQEEGVCQ